MAKKRMFHIQHRVGGRWASLPEMMFVSKEYAKGYLASEAGHYPSRELQVVDAETGEVISKQNGNGEVRTNQK